MRRTLVAGLTASVMVVFGVAATALAGGYETPTAGQTPHGNYANSTTKCKVCHAVHNAADTDVLLGGSTEALLRSARLNSCTYCHVVGAWSITKVYGGVLGNYTGDSRYNHDSNHALVGGSSFYRGCVSCHSVHGSNVLNGYEAQIVRSNPNSAWNDIVVSDLTSFCRDCHDDWQTNPHGGRCGFCHNFIFQTRGGMDENVPQPRPKPNRTDQYPTFYSQQRNDVTHVMTTTLTGNYGTQVAWGDSDECRDCHAGGNYTQGNNFPHYTSGAYFLDDAYAPPDGPPGTPDSGMDRVCLNCHVQGGDGAAYTTGVGKTF